MHPHRACSSRVEGSEGPPLNPGSGLHAAWAQPALSEAGSDRSRWGRSGREQSTTTCGLLDDAKLNKQVVERGWTDVTLSRRPGQEEPSGDRARKDRAVAITATARELACLIYLMVTRGEEYVEKGMDAYPRDSRDQRPALRLQAHLRGVAGGAPVPA